VGGSKRRLTANIVRTAAKVGVSGVGSPALAPQEDAPLLLPVQRPTQQDSERGQNNVLSLSARSPATCRQLPPKLLTAAAAQLELKKRSCLTQRTPRARSPKGVQLAGPAKQNRKAEGGRKREQSFRTPHGSRWAAALPRGISAVPLYAPRPKRDTTQAGNTAYFQPRVLPVASR
jgi:hypothetical protein